MTQTATEYRQRLAGVIAAALRSDAAVRAIGEGGAVARGRADDYSDLDLMIVAPLSAADAIFACVESAIAAVGTISHVWCVEPPGFADMAQRFYFMEGAPRFFAVDCSVVTESSIAAFTERERHGEAVIWFDPEGLMSPRPADSAALQRRRRQRLAQLRGSTPVYQMLVEKELARGHALEAFGFYQVLLRALIELLGMKHRPERFDFSWRYVERELPSEARATIARHAFVAGGQALLPLAASLVTEIAALLDTADTVERAADLNAAAPADRPSP